jgi:hypothetical protein
MALPKLTTPTYELEIPSTDEKIKYRPFLVREEKILLIALESGESKDIITAIKDIVTECTYGKIDLGKMPMFDVEYVFLQIRSKSVGEVSTLKLLCPDDKETYVNVDIDLSEIMVQVDEGHNPKIELTDEMGMNMTYPSIDSLSATGVTDITADNMLDVIGACILQIYDKKGEEVFETKDQTKKEISEFVETLNTKQYQEVQKFIDNMPKLKHTVEIDNPKTKVKSKVVLIFTPSVEF